MFFHTGFVNLCVVEQDTVAFLSDVSADIMSSSIADVMSSSIADVISSSIAGFNPEKNAISIAHPNEQFLAIVLECFILNAMIILK